MPEKESFITSQREREWAVREAELIVAGQNTQADKIAAIGKRGYSPKKPENTLTSALERLDKLERKVKNNTEILRRLRLNLPQRLHKPIRLHSGSTLNKIEGLTTISTRCILLLTPHP